MLSDSIRQKAPMLEGSIPDKQREIVTTSFVVQVD